MKLNQEREQFMHLLASLLSVTLFYEKGDVHTGQKENNVRSREGLCDKCLRDKGLCDKGVRGKGLRDEGIRDEGLRDEFESLRFPLKGSHKKKSLHHVTNID